MTDVLTAALRQILGPDGPGEPAPGGCLAVRSPAGTTSVVLGSRQTIGVAHDLPMTLGTFVDLGSVTKIVATTTAVMTLVEQHRLDLSDPVGRFVPGLSAPLAEVSLDDLLLHRAGLWEWWPLYLAAATPDAVIAGIGRLPLRYRPGSGRHYSDLGFLLLGDVVSRICAAPLDVAVGELVLRPWQLSSTGYGSPLQPGPVAATSVGDRIESRMIDTGHPYPVEARSADFDGWRDRVLVGEVNDGNAFHGCGGTAGHAGLFSTVPDLLDFGGGLLDSLTGDGPLRPETVTAFLTEGPDAGQARGFRSWPTTVDGCAATAWGHPGFPGVSVAVLPRHRATVVLSTNRLHVLGEPRPHEPSWRLALDAAHRLLHRQDLPDRTAGTEAGMGRLLR